MRLNVIAAFQKQCNGGHQNKQLTHKIQSDFDEGQMHGDMRENICVRQWSFLQLG